MIVDPQGGEEEQRDPDERDEDARSGLGHDAGGRLNLWREGGVRPRCSCSWRRYDAL